jgi:hypothetical protein
MVILLAGVWAVSAQASIDHGYAEEQEGSEEGMMHDIIDDRALTPAVGVGLEVDIDVTLEPSSPTKTHRLPYTHATTFQSPSRSRSKAKARSECGIGLITTAPMSRQPHSEGGLQAEGSMSMHTLHPTSPGTSPHLRARVGLPRTSSHRTPPAIQSELLSPTTTRSSQRRRATVLDPHYHLYPHGGSSIRTVSSSISMGAGAQGMSPAGLTIGLSPVSPGFGFGVGPGGVGVGGQGQRRSRRVSGLGLSFSDVVESVQDGVGLEVADGDRRRAVSEGDVRRQRWDGEQGEQVSCDEEEADSTEIGGPACDAHRDAEIGLDRRVRPLTAGLRWKWLQKVFVKGPVR